MNHMHYFANNIWGFHWGSIQGNTCYINLLITINKSSMVECEGDLKVSIKMEKRKLHKLKAEVGAFLDIDQPFIETPIQTTPIGIIYEELSIIDSIDDNE